MGKWCSACLLWFGLDEESNKDDEEASSLHLAGLGWVVEYSAERRERVRREREVITVVKSTGNVASPWRLVMIAAAGNNETPTLHDYWPTSLTLDKSNNAHYPHIPLYSHTSEGEEAANEICCAGSWVGWRLWLTGGRLPAVLCDVTTLTRSLSLSISVHPLFSSSPTSLILFLSDLTLRLCDKEGRLVCYDDTRRVLTAVWIHNRQKSTFTTGRKSTRYSTSESERQIKREKAQMWLYINL